MNTGDIKCKRCNGKGEYRKRIYYERKIFYYYKKCWRCYGEGHIDWIENARGRKPGIAGMFVDCHPAGSSIIAPKELGGCSVYDGHKYVSIQTPRGEALWNKLVNEE